MMAWLALLDRSVWVQLIAILVLLLPVYWLAIYLWIPTTSRRQFRQRRTMHTAVFYSWSDEALSYRSSNANGTFPWSDLHRWTEGRHSFLFYLEDRMFHFVPRRVLSDEQVEDLRRTAKAFGPKEI
jgi:hypothetical protein